MGRSPCCDKVGLRKGTWTPEEDQKLLAYIQQHGHGSWRALPVKAGLQRCGKSCRLRWTNYLRPDIKRGKFTLQEEQNIIQLHALLGNRWSAIAAHLPKRTDNEIKNHWNTHLKKRLNKMGIDPSTHKPKTNPFVSGGQQKDNANLSHIAQWESARLEAESRLVRGSRLSVQSPMRRASKQLPPLQPIVLPCLDVLKAWQGTWKSPCTANNGFFNPGGTLQSPTSTLHFSDSSLTSPTTTATTPTTTTPTTNTNTMSCFGPFGDNLGLSAITYIENPKPLIEVGVTKGNGPNSSINRSVVEINDQDDLVDYPNIDSAAYFEDSLRSAPGFLEGFIHDADGTDQTSNNITLMESILHGSSAGCGDDDLEDNKKYWNSILNGENPATL